MTWKEINKGLKSYRYQLRKAEFQVAGLRESINQLNNVYSGCSHEVYSHYTIADDHGTRGCYDCDREYAMRRRSGRRKAA